ncbi:hypothetical protein [Flindersiella endophytica]
MNLEKLLDRPALKNLRNLVATIRAASAVLFALSATGVLGSFTFLRHLIGSGVALTVGIILGVWGLTMMSFWYYVEHIYDPTFYEILELDGLLIVEPVGDHHRYTYIRKQKVRSTRRGLRLIEFRAHWTGRGSRGTVRVESLMGDHVLLDGQRAEEEGYVHRWIYAHRPLGKRREITVGVRQTHEDDVEVQHPYFRESGGRYKTHKITTTVRFPRDEDPQSLGFVEGMIWNGNAPPRHDRVAGSLVHVRTVNSETNTVDYTVTECRPKPYHSYGIAWTWPSRYYLSQNGQTAYNESSSKQEEASMGGA